MKKLWSNKWNSSTQIRKQRKYIFNAPLHIRHILMNTHLSKELRKEYNLRHLPIRVGDEVKINSGQFKGKVKKVVKVRLCKLRVYLEEIGIKRNDGSLSLYPIHPSNLEIVKLDKTDDKRVKKLEKLKQLNTQKKEVKK